MRMADASWLLLTALDPPMPARAYPVEVLAVRLGAVAIEMDADRATATAAADSGRASW